MLEIIAEIKAEAEREKMLAQAKIEVAEAIEAKFRAKVCEEVCDENSYDETVTDENDEVVSATYAVSV